MRLSVSAKETNGGTVQSILWTFAVALQGYCLGAVGSKKCRIGSHGKEEGWPGGQRRASAAPEELS